MNIRKNKQKCCEIAIETVLADNIDICPFCEHEYKNRKKCNFCGRLYFYVHSSAFDQIKFCSAICEEQSR